MRKNIRRFLPLIVLIVLVLMVYLTNLHHYFTIDSLREKHLQLKNFVNDHPIISPLIYISFYIISVILVIPDSTILSLLAGLIFPLPLALIFAIFSETVGALVFFTIFHGAFGKTLFERERPFLNKMRKQFKMHAPSYLLFLRISHVIPFWLTNLSAAYFRVTYWTFFWTCFIGVIPFTYVMVDAGHSLSDIFARNEAFTLDDIFTTQLKLGLLFMGLLAFLPIVFKKIFKKRKWKR